jgi:hypothetical protein
MPRWRKCVNISKTTGKLLSPTLLKLSGQCKVNRTKNKVINLELMIKSTRESIPVFLCCCRPGFVKTVRMTCDANVTIHIDCPFSNISKGANTFEMKGA